MLYKKLTSNIMIKLKVKNGKRYTTLKIRQEKTEIAIAILNKVH